MATPAFQEIRLNQVPVRARTRSALNPAIKRWALVTLAFGALAAAACSATPQTDGTPPSADASLDSGASGGATATGGSIGSGGVGSGGVGSGGVVAVGGRDGGGENADGSILDGDGGAGGAGGAAVPGCPDGGTAGIHLELNEAFFNDPTRSILFVGASLTADGRYIDRLVALLKGKFPQFKATVHKRGLNSETLSGLTEDGHPGPRPVLFERLDAVLKEARPHLVFSADYGLNDAIYHPFDESRFDLFKKGVARLQATIQAAGAELIMLTPTPFEAEGVPSGQIRDMPPYKWSTPYRGYDTVMGRYSDWLLSLRNPTQRVLDIRAPLLDYMKAQRATNPGYRLTEDGIHPNAAGYNSMAEAIFKQLFNTAPPPCR